MVQALVFLKSRLIPSLGRGMQLQVELRFVTKMPVSDALEESNMQTKSHPKALTSTLHEIANNFRLTGWISFWMQLGLAVVCAISLLFAWSGRNFSEQTHQGIGISIFWAVLGILVLAASVYWDFRYTRIAKRLRHPHPDMRPSKADTVGFVRLGLIMSLVGMLVMLLGSGAAIGVLVAKSVSQPPGVAITDPNRIIRALDVFVTVANVNGVGAHFIGTVASLWLLERVYRH